MIINNKKVQDQQNGIITDSSAMYQGQVHINSRQITFYDKPPQDTIGIFEFQSKAVSRLQVLKKIEFLYASNMEGNNDQMAQEINQYSRKHKLNVEGHFDISSKTFGKMTIKERDEAQSNDNISHFICRLAYCRNDELRRWFATQETRLFYHRLASFEAEDVLKVLREKCNMNYEQLKDTDEVWLKYAQQITFNLDRFKIKRTEAKDFIKVPFKDALSLVAMRQVFVHKGTAFVNIQDLNSIARSQFRSKLMGELAKAYKFLPTILTDDRLRQILLNLSNHNTIDFNISEVTAPKDSDKIRLSDLDYYSRQSFPPCMKVLFTALKNQHHLKHFGRLQLGLFLKGVGLTMDEATKFWKDEFCKKIDADKFEKNYGYNIRHMYGQEGKRNDYKGWNCVKVINQQAPGQGEYQGCPFKTFGDENLRQLLSGYGLTSSDMKVVLDKKKENLYQVACLRLFEMTHKGSIAENVGNHPNAYLNSSLQYKKDMEKKNKPAVAASKTPEKMEVQQKD